MATGATVPFDTYGEVRLARPRWRVALSLLRPVWLVAALFGYGLILGGAGRWLALFGAILVVAFGWPVGVAVASLVPQLTGPVPALSTDGVRIRLRPWHRRLVTIPWSEITSVWIGYRGSRAYLCLTADPRGAHADEWDPRRRRFRGGASPQLAVYLPDRVSVEEVRGAVAALSGATVTLADRGPDAGTDSGPDDDAWADVPRRSPASFDEQRRSVHPSVVALLLAGAVVGVPAALDVAPPWNQPWWPGITAASRIPDACGVFDADQAETLGVTARRRTSDDPAHRECEFTVPQGELQVSIERFHAFVGRNDAKAADGFRSLSGAMPSQTRRLPGVGDEARLLANAQGTTTMFDRAVVRLVARRANVVLVIVYGGEREPEVAQEAVIGAARSTLAGLDIG
jgi:hypothetical protein